jgi:alpha-beta hydrolase superfamily lysophospholipase
MILSGTPLHYARMLPGPLFQVVKLLNNIVPRLPISPNLGTSSLSTDPAVVEAYNSDPLVYHGWLPVRLVYYMLSECRALSQQLGELRLPLLIAHGAEDTLCLPAGSRLLYESASSADKTLKIMDGLRHEIHNEAEQASVLALVADWLDAHC